MTFVVDAGCSTHDLLEEHRAVLIADGSLGRKLSGPYAPIVMVGLRELGLVDGWWPSVFDEDASVMLTDAGRAMRDHLRSELTESRPAPSTPTTTEKGDDRG